MGGNCMKSFGAKRITAKQKVSTVADIEHWLWLKGCERFEPVRELKDKPSYGDWAQLPR